MWLLIIFTKSLYICVVLLSFMDISLETLLSNSLKKFPNINPMSIFEWFLFLKVDLCAKSVVYERLFYISWRRQGTYLLANSWVESRNILKRACSATQSHTHIVSILQLMFTVCSYRCCYYYCRCCFHYCCCCCCYCSSL